MERRTWRHNAVEFAGLDRQDPWLFARLVACSVEPGDGTGNRNARNGSGKVSARRFAQEANTSAPRVLRYLAGWDRAAERGWVTPSSQLTPADTNAIVPTEAERSFLDETGRLRLVSKKAPQPRLIKNRVFDIPRPVQLPHQVGRQKSGLRVITEQAGQAAIRAARFRWMGALHTAASGLHNVLDQWSEIEPHLGADEMAEVTALLDDVEDDLLNLRSRLADRVLPD